MKNFFRLVLLLALARLTMPCHAQSLDRFFQQQYEGLSKNALETGILIHRSPIFIWPGKYNGQNRADSMQVDIDKFGVLYGQFLGAANQPESLPAPAVYLDRALRPFRMGDTLDLVFMAMRFDHLRGDALERNLVEWHNGKLRDVVGRSASPYAQDTCFAFAALHKEVEGETICFRLPPDLLLGNLQQWAAIQIDFGDGKGFRAVTPGEVVTVTYTSAGHHNLVLRYGTNIVAVSGITTLNPGPAGGGNSVPYDVDHPEVVKLSGMTLSVFSACEDKKIRRPLVVVEGFTGRQSTKNLFDLLQQTTTSSDQLIDWFNTREYDLIWIDYHDAFTSIEQNGANLIEALEWINARKHADGSAEPNVMIGASMGGLVCKYALLEMHNVLGKDSEVERFFSYDAPLKGANYPIGFQAFIRDFLNIAAQVGASTAAFQGAIRLLDSPAAKEMLATRVNIGNPGPGGTTAFIVGPPPEFTVLQNTIAQLEQIRPLNGITRHIVLSNGANMGVLQENVALQMYILSLFAILDSAPSSLNPSGPEWCYDVILSARAYAATTASTLIYERRIEVRVNLVCEGLGDDYIYSSTDLTIPAPLNLDNAPGGNSNLGLDILENSLHAIIGTLHDVKYSDAKVGMTSFAFIPTVSSLDMPLGSSTTTTTPNGGGSVSRWTASNDNSVISDFSGLPEFNQAHVSMNTRIADVLVDELEPTALTVPPLVVPMGLGTIYNFGRASSSNTNGAAETPRVISENLTIGPGNQVWVNRDGRIGYTNNPNNPPNNHPQQFVVLVPGTNCAEDKDVIVTVEGRGSIKIGQYEPIQNIGQLRFGKGGHLIVKANDGVQIEKKSTLAIEGGADMSVEFGASVIANEGAHILVQNNSELVLQRGATLSLNFGADCVVRNNSRIVIEAGAILQISHSKTNLTVQEGGALILLPGAIVRLWDGQQDDGEAFIKVENGGKLRVEGEFDLSGNGYFWLRNAVNYEDLRSEVHYSGHNKTCRLFFLDNCSIALNKTLRLEKLEVDCNGLGGFYLQNGRTYSTDVSFEGVGGNPIAMQIHGGGFFAVQRTDFVGFEHAMEIYDNQNTSSALPYIENSQVLNCNIGIQMVNCRSLICNNSQFSCKFAGLYLDNVSNIVNVNNSSLTADTYGAWLKDVPRFRMSGGSVSGCEFGLYAPELSRTNITLTNKASVEHNETGIYVAQGFQAVLGNTIQNFGLVLMDCARLLDNQTGIMGTNVLLQIDVLPNGSGSLRSNHFRVADNGSDQLFNICYDGSGYSFNTIHARGNFWQGACSLPNEPWQLYSTAIDFSPPIGCNTHNLNNITVLRTPNVVVEPPSTCPRLTEEVVVTESGESNCLLAESLGEGRLDQRFLQAYATYSKEAELGNNDLFASSSDLFQPLADLSSEGMADLCSGYVAAARAFVAGTFQERAGSLDRSYNHETVSQTLSAFPNPASGSVTVVQSSNGLLRITNAIGHTVYEAAGQGNQSIDVRNWPNGVYWVKNIPQDNSAKCHRIKLLVTNN